MSLLFILNPLTCYFSSFYSEALFFFTQICVLYPLQKSLVKSQKITPSALSLSLLAVFVGCVVRSNGFLSIGYPLYYCIVSTYSNTINENKSVQGKEKKDKNAKHSKSLKHKKKHTGLKRVKEGSSLLQNLVKIMKVVVVFLPFIVLVFVPFVVYNLWGFHQICSPEVPEFAKSSEYCAKYTSGRLHYSLMSARFVKSNRQEINSNAYSFSLNSLTNPNIFTQHDTHYAKSKTPLCLQSNLNKYFQIIKPIYQISRTTSFINNPRYISNHLSTSPL